MSMLVKLQRLLLLALVVSGHGVAQSDPWTAMRVFEGKWEGPATGEPGKGISAREYRFDLGGRFLSARNKSTYEPKTPTAKRRFTRTSECLATIARSRRSCCVSSMPRDSSTNIRWMP